VLPPAQAPAATATANSNRWFYVKFKPLVTPTEAQAEMWWALWCFRDSEEATDRRLYFPEVVVIPLLATRAAI
jgi:hypothetical protein